MNLSNELTKQVKAHLGDVRKYLGALPADERQEILQSIESHIYDALETRSDGTPTPELLDAVIAEMDPPESYSQPAADQVALPKPRPWWKRWWGQLVIGVVVALILRTFFLQSFRVETDAAAPEIPRGSCFLAWNLARSFAPGDLITYKYNDRVNIGRVARVEKETLWVNRSAQPDMAVPRDIVLGKVISVWWRAPNRTAPDARSEPNDPTGRWISVDFVSSIEQFDPDTIQWTNDFSLTDLTLLAGGKTDRPYWTWEDGVLHHSGDNTDAKFFIKKISGEEYLFLEWISGDVIHKGNPLKYHVLRK